MLYSFVKHKVGLLHRTLHLLKKCVFVFVFGATTYFAGQLIPFIDGTERGYDFAVPRIIQALGYEEAEDYLWRSKIEPQRKHEAIKRLKQYRKCAEAFKGGD